MALSDDVYVRVQYWEERDKYIEEEIIPIDPMWNKHSVTIYEGATEIIGREWAPVAFDCSCGNRFYSF